MVFRSLSKKSHLLMNLTKSAEVWSAQFRIHPFFKGCLPHWEEVMFSQAKTARGVTA